MKKLVLLLAMLIAMNAWAVDEWSKARPAGSASPSTIDTLLQANNESIDRLLSNYREGCKIEYLSASTLTVELGEVVCSNSAGTLRKFRSNTSDTSVSWSDIDTGSEAVSTTYYVYAVADASATTFTVEISLSSSAPTGATYFKRLGSFYNNNDGDILNDETIVNDNNYYALQLGDWLSKSASVVYQASTDGFVVGYIDDTGGGDCEVIGYTDSSSPPTTVRSWLEFRGVDDGHGTITFPVKLGDYWKVSVGDVGVANSLYWIPNE